MISARPSFGASSSGASPARASASRAGQHLVAEPGLALADQAEPDVGEHAEIAGARPSRAPARPARRPRSAGRRAPPRPSGRAPEPPAGDPVRAHEHRRTDGVGRKRRRRPRSRGRGSSGARPPRAASGSTRTPTLRPEPGCQPVGLAPLREVALDDCAAGLDPRHGLRPERDRGPLPRHAHERLERQPVACQLDRRGHASVAVVYAGSWSRSTLPGSPSRTSSGSDSRTTRSSPPSSRRCWRRRAGEAVLEPRVHLEPDPARQGPLQRAARRPSRPLGLAGREDRRRLRRELPARAALRARPALPLRPRAPARRSRCSRRPRSPRCAPAR